MTDAACSVRSIFPNCRRKRSRLGPAGKFTQRLISIERTKPPILCCFDHVNALREITAASNRFDVNSLIPRQPLVLLRESLEIMRQARPTEQYP